jgi:hypothetical protein
VPQRNARKPIGAGGVAQEDEVAVETRPHCRFVDLERAVQHLLVDAAAEHQVAEVLVPVGPSRAVVVEHARHLVGARCQGDVVQAQVAVEQDPVARRRRARRVLVALQDAADGAQQPGVRNHARQRGPESLARLRPRQPVGQPAGHIPRPRAGVLLGEDAAERAADPPRQCPVGLRPAVERPRIIDTGNELAELPTRLVRVQHARRSERAARGQQVEDAALHGEPPRPGRVHGEPRHAVAGQRDGPAILARLDPHGPRIDR